MKKEAKKIAETKDKAVYRIIMLLLFIFLIIFLIACSSQGPKSACGNKIIEAGEACDGTGCPADKVCTDKCKCENFSPPSLPQ